MTTSPIDGNPLLEPWTAPFEAPPFDRIEPRHFRPGVRRRARSERAPRSTPSPPIRRRRASPIRSRRSSAAAAASTKWRASSSISPARRPMTSCRRSSARSRPVLARHRNETYLNDALFRRIDALEGRRRTSSGFRPNRRACSSAIISISPAPAQASPPEAKARLAAIAERLATLGAEFGQNVLADEKAWLDAARTRPISTACRISSSPAPRASPPTAAIPASTRSRCRGRASSRSCNSRRGATCARTPFAPGPRAAKTAARPTTAPSPPRWCACGPSGRVCSDTRLTPITASPTRWRKRRGGARSARVRSGRRAWPARARTSEALQAIVASEGGNFKVAPWDWRYLAGKAAQGRVRLRRGRAQAVSAARPHDRGGLLCREPPVRA